ncbi:DNA processing protein [Clostridium cavendishii DSM 21758]|uniref:DNA processing protein n=1 Tax=Clostridium cavendishii DSM 21758 TaxID=1121302 RepID=A0A1M6RK32_9CLOT|nr:DNA-processing protein DprA [Clostridium cavendishii]SHK32796.1 DNA processing protein [Clostridium cavendishii DSM 21758]
MDNMEFKLWFANINISNRIKFILLEQFKDEQSIYENRKDICKVNKKLEMLMQFNIDSEIIYSQLEAIQKEIYSLIFYNDAKYPQNIKCIDDYPYVLYYKGDLEKSKNKKNIAIVGSRKCSSYGIEATEYIVSNFEGLDLVLTSGGAYGVDTIVHKTSINKNIYNIAILGCGININYPASNKLLYEKIKENGLIISEFSPQTKPYSYNFPMRNRIISGLSDAVIVVEASSKGGSLITARYAAEQGREVIAVPGSIFSPLSLGVNKLIDDGAKIFTTIEDLLYILKIPKKQEKTKNINRSLKGNILKLLEDKPMHIDEIIRLMHIDTSVIYELLFEMQFNKEIISLTGNYYAKII